MSKTVGKEMTSQEYKDEIKKMLSFIHGICKANNIHYTVAFGTLLGTVRHNGFIPWDDDIDIYLLGEDYPRFCELMEQNTDKYYILAPEKTPNYYNAMCRICSNAGILKLKGVIKIDNLGPFIDIFRVYREPSNADERMQHYNEIKETNLNIQYSLPIRYYMNLSPENKIRAAYNVFKRIKTRMMMGTEKLVLYREELLKKYENTQSAFCCPVTELYVSDKRTLSIDEIMDVELHSFEDIEVFIPRKYDEVLTRGYGDYMKLPPEEKRISHHHFTPYWK